VKRAVALIAVAIAVAIGATVVAGGDDPGSGTVAGRARDIAAGLRCPVCLNLSVADSPSRLAGEMRAAIASRVRSGETEEEIRAYFVDRYGEWILLEPTRRGLNLLPWALPVVALIGGLAVWLALVRRRPPLDDMAASESERRRIEHELRGLEEPT
jgi:cytochrome c-type biogenesis protein CcmH